MAAHCSNSVVDIAAAHVYTLHIMVMVWTRRWWLPAFTSFLTYCFFSISFHILLSALLVL